tara:strand:+ start:696 stop:839 length:144 start_codon:yes stop_codon:yes gene_type:complete
VLADRLKKSLQEVMEFTTAELELWAGYLQLEANANKKHMRDMKRKKR